MLRVWNRWRVKCYKWLLWAISLAETYASIISTTVQANKKNQNCSSTRLRKVKGFMDVPTSQNWKKLYTTCRFPWHIYAVRRYLILFQMLGYSICANREQLCWAARAQTISRQVWMSMFFSWQVWPSTMKLIRMTIK